MPKVYVYSTKSGKLLWKVDGHPGDRLGIGVEAAGDTNGDGIPDVIASAPGAGKAYIFSGNDGKLLVTMADPPKMHTDNFRPPRIDRGRCESRRIRGRVHRRSGKSQW